MYDDAYYTIFSLHLQYLQYNTVLTFRYKTMLETI